MPNRLITLPDAQNVVPEVKVDRREDEIGLPDC